MYSKNKISDFSWSKPWCQTRTASLARDLSREVKYFSALLGSEMKNVGNPSSPSLYVGSKKPNVLVATGLFPPEIGGPATYSHFLALHLPAHGITTTVVPFREVRKYPRGVRHIVYLIKLLLGGKDADIIYAQDTMSVGAPAALASMLLGKKLIVRVPGDHVWEQGTARFGITGPLEDMPAFSFHWHPFLALMRIIQRGVVYRARALVVPSAYMARVVEKWPGAKGKVRVIYNGVEQFTATGNKPVLRGLLNFQGPLVISIGRLVPWKGFQGLITIVPALTRRFPDLKLLIVGGGPDLRALEEQAEKLHVADSVVFAGEVERDVLIRYIRASDVFILNSRYEGLSHQILEVMSVGVPVIATDVGGNPEVITDGKTGYLVSPDDARAITKHIEALIESAELRARITGAAKRAVRHFSNEHMVAETAALMESIST